MIVIDASVGVKWFLDEAGSHLATDLLLSQLGEMAAPDLFGIEVGATLVREANSRKGVAADMRLAIERLANLFAGHAVELFATQPENLLASANLAINLGHPLKDCLYLALAMELECELVTADARFAGKACEVWDRVRLLGA